jgi:hypothetical protein
VVVEGVGLAGREEAVMRILLKGCVSLALGSVGLWGGRGGASTHVECLCAFSDDAFESADEVTRRALFLLDVARPVLFACT